MAEHTPPMPTRRLGRWMILAGVAVWLVYGIVWLIGGSPQAAHYLPVHLSGVLPGVVLSRWQTITGWVTRSR
ncbi:MAG: hypothetical protein KKE89_05915 [Actinobacteria bacterium]|nr:hypothetical protein [Actinomycetota bacterium]MBU1865932.1 hypothetical protein [Actinomycetota bacterium]